MKKRLIWLSVIFATLVALVVGCTQATPIPPTAIPEKATSPPEATSVPPTSTPEEATSSPEATPIPTEETVEETPQETDLEGKLIIFHAGSLTVPVDELAKAFQVDHPNVTFETEAAGSRTTTRKVSELD
ncbi:MAG: hypothetical protein R6V13_06490, partial [Anaerolineae bacterium]